MKLTSIKHLAYLMSEAKNEKRPKPIFFLGAGASRSAGIPTAWEIIKDIKDRYSRNPLLQKIDSSTSDYAEYMDCLSPFQRNELLKKYIQEAKINLTHIYLAHLIINDFVDYVLTVNFDNLMVRTLALNSEFLPTYDLAILKDLTTTSFQEKSIVHLHGQHHGLWLLNTPEELNKVADVIPPILHSIKNQRPWVFIGYSGDDPIFEHIRKLGRFDNGFFWVCFKDQDPSPKVMEFLNEHGSNNSAVIKGYDADSFMKALNKELGLPNPDLLSNPQKVVLKMFSSLGDESRNQTIEKVEQGFIGSGNVQKAEPKIKEIISSHSEEEKIEINSIKDRLLSISEARLYDSPEAIILLEKAEEMDSPELTDLLWSYYINWGVELGNQRKDKSIEESKELIGKAIDLFEKASLKKPDDYLAYYNWGTDLGNLATISTGDQSNIYYQEAIEKFEIAIQLNPSYELAYKNLGYYLGQYASNLSGEESIELHFRAIKALEHELKFSSEKSTIYNSLGFNYGRASQLQQGSEAEKNRIRAIELFEEAINLQPDFALARNNLAYYLGLQAREFGSEDGLGWFERACQEFDNALDLEPDFQLALNNYAVLLKDFGKNLSKEKAQKSYKKAIELWSKLLESKPSDADIYFNLGYCYGELAVLGQEPEENFKMAFNKYKKATDLNPQFASAFANWGYCLGEYARTKEPTVAEYIYKDAFDKLNTAITLNEDDFNSLVNYGYYLGEFGYLIAPEDKDEYYSEALEKLETAEKLNSENSLPLANQGRIYSYMAELKTGTKAKSLYEKGIEKYKEALKLNSSEIDSLSGIVHLLIHYSKLLPDSEKDKIYQEALEYTKKVKELIGYSYNLACVYALMNKRKEAFAELSVALSHAEVSPQHVEGDFEWENFRDDKEFQEILKKYK